MILEDVVKYAAETHDLGKLDDENQAVLRQSNAKGRLPVHHQDAGAAWLVSVDALLSAYLVKSHHRGLCDIVEESSQDKPYCRDEDTATRERTDHSLAELVNRHSLTGSLPGRFPPREVTGDLPVFLRMALSCLADADHTDTARHYRQYPEREIAPDLRADERLTLLNDCMAALSKTREGGRIDEVMRDRDYDDFIGYMAGIVRK